MRDWCRQRPGLAVALTLAVVSAGSGESGSPLRWGVDDAGLEAGAYGRARVGAIAEEFDFDLWVVHYHPPGTDSTTTVKENVRLIQEIDAWCGARNVQWIANLEHANGTATLTDERCRDWYNRADGRHHFLFPDEVMRILGAADHLAGVMYDEPAHTQNERHRSLGGALPFLYSPDLADGPAAGADGFYEAAANLAAVHQAAGIGVYTEHVFPILFHSFARAGFTAVPKVLKDGWSPVFLAAAMGAALQYETEFWVSPDLWGMKGFPGHSVDEYRSALLLSYGLGAEGIYTENLALDPGGEGSGGLVRLVDGGYELTDYGRAARRFRSETVPAHPRGYSVRNVRPRVVIVRRPDSDWGQARSWMSDALFGAPQWHSTKSTRAWNGLWHLLSRGVVNRSSPSWHHKAYARREYQVFCPLEGVVVFDDRVQARLLASAELIVLTGLGVSPRTLRAVEDRVAAGATCVALPHLVPQRIHQALGQGGELSDGAGRWVVGKDFMDRRVRPHIERFAPPENRIRYRFGDSIVTLRPVDGDPNRLALDISPISAAPAKAQGAGGDSGGGFRALGSPAPG